MSGVEEREERRKSNSYDLLPLQIFGQDSRGAIEEGVRNYALGFVGLAVTAGLANFLAVSPSQTTSFWNQNP